MKQARQFGYLAKICLVIWRDFIWLFGDGLPHKLRLVSQVTYAAKRRASNALRTAGGTRWALSRWGNAWIHEFDAVIRKPNELDIWSNDYFVQLAEMIRMD